MALSSDHYERAFEDYLRRRLCPYVVVDETRKKAFAEVQLKNFDFLVYSSCGANLLVDVKGRKFPDLSITGRRRGGRPWENWVTREDIEGLAQWEAVFGRGFRATLVFAYWLQGPPEKTPFGDLHVYQGRHYAFSAITQEAYRASAKPRSAKWRTLTMPAGAFREAVCDVGDLL